ncbi:MAG: hypothetical protein H0W49_16155 [Nitrospirales bacterium]|nr:hypothetical protein [Nitrospirales bacterium]
MDDLSSELLEGEAQVKTAMGLAKDSDKSEIKVVVEQMDLRGQSGGPHCHRLG